jgi:hypothetical protein
LNCRSYPTLSTTVCGEFYRQKDNKTHQDDRTIEAELQTSLTKKIKFANKLPAETLSNLPHGHYQENVFNNFPR